MTDSAITFRQSLAYFVADIEERAQVEKKTVTKITFIKALFNPALVAIGFYRLQHWLASHGLAALAELLHLTCIAMCKVDIASRAKIGPGFVIFHANGIYVGPQCHFGTKVYLYHHCGAGLAPAPGAASVSGTLVLEDNVVVACGARVSGPVVIGRRSFIAPNEAVTTSIPARSFFIDGKVAERPSRRPAPVVEAADENRN